MARGDGKNKFYKLLKIPDEVKLLIRFYNKVWKKRAIKTILGNSVTTSGKVTSE